jgi:hypothetical protein
MVKRGERERERERKQRNKFTLILMHIIKGHKRSVPFPEKMKLTVAIPNRVQLRALGVDGSRSKGRCRCGKGKGGESGLHGDSFRTEKLAWRARARGGGEERLCWIFDTHARSQLISLKYTPCKSIRFGKYLSLSKSHALQLPFPTSTPISYNFDSRVIIHYPS